MHDPDTLVVEFLGVQIWHHDPCTDGTDDSCGWFKRARHGDKKVLENIIKRYDFDWDRTFISDEGKGKMYMCGWFTPEGRLVHSTMGITLNLIWIAAYEHFNHNRDKANKLCQNRLFDILFFSENPTDSISDAINQKWGIEDRKKRMEDIARCTYGWVLRADRKWYNYPRFHFWHYRINFPIYWRIKRSFDKNPSNQGCVSPNAD